MRLHALQCKLESIYGLRLEQRIDDFLTTDREIAAELVSSERASREQVLVQQDGADVLLSLYLDAEVYASFCRHPATGPVSGRQAGEFCLAAEGVSHFLYLCWNANFEREVTHLELELQAEVDKYLLLLEYAAEDSDEHLHPWLFEQWQFDDGLNEEEQNRYEHANRYAGKYCLGLQQRYLRIGRKREMVNELRRFYRKTQSQKLRMIDSFNTH